MTESEHCFVIPAYGDSPHLAECLESLSSQSLPSPILVCTSTPNKAIETAASEFGAILHVNPAGGGIGKDWNFALSKASSKWVTIAHQDDVYLPDFSERTLEAARSVKDGVLVFTDYAELQDGIRPSTALLRIKRVLLELGFLGGAIARNTFMKVNTLRFGCSIPCPAVTINQEKAALRFREDLKIDLDWAAWLELAKAPGAYCYVRKVCMLHRVHEQSETTAGIASGIRSQEDLLILQKMWPKAIANAILSTYHVAYKSNAS